MKFKNTKTTYAVILYGLMLGGCAATAPETRVYSLSSTQADELRSEKTSQTSIGVGPLSFPDQLKRPQIISRVTENRLTLSEAHHWSGDLETEFLNTLVRDLINTTGISTIYAYPWDNRRRPEIQIQLNVFQFDGALGGESILAANWSIVSSDGKKLIDQENVEISEPHFDDSYESLVAAQSRLIGRMARLLSAALQRN